jgi:hypothetical protein
MLIVRDFTKRRGRQKSFIREVVSESKHIYRVLSKNENPGLGVLESYMHREGTVRYFQLPIEMNHFSSGHPEVMPEIQ